MRVTLKQLRYFSMLARELHFGRAAELCSVSQPALSMQIQELERELGTALIERRHSGVTLTDHGREVAVRAARILGEVHDLVDYGRHQSRLLCGPFHLGVIPTVAPYLLPLLLPRLREDHPELELHLRETQTATLLAELSSQSLDAVLLALPAGAADVETMPLVQDRFVLAIPPGKRARGKKARAEDLVASERLLLLEEGHCLRDQALSFCRMQQVDGVYTFGASSLSTLVRMVANGHGVTLLPEICLPAEVRGGEVRIIRFPDPPPSRMLGLAWRASSPRKRDFAALGGLMAELLAGEVNPAGTSKH